MAEACCNSCERMVHTAVEDEVWLASTRTFSRLMGTQLLVAVCANVYLLRATTQQRFPVHWDTFRLVLRHSSVVDLSLCVAVAGVVIWSSFVLNHDTFTVSCTCYSLSQGLLAGAVAVGGGIVVCCRQASTFVLFNDEAPLLRENCFRVVNLLRNVSVVAVVGLVVVAVARCLMPSFEVSMCFVVGAMPPRAVYLLVLPVIVNVGIGLAFVAQAKCPEADRKQSLHIALSSETLVEQSSLAVQDGHTGVSDSRWRRFNIVVNVGFTWFTMAAAMAMAGVLMPPPSIDTLLIMTGCTTACSVWSAVSVFLYWT